MFERLAKFRGIAQWFKTPLGRLVRLQDVYSNDNRPGFGRPDGRGLRPHQALACHWFFVPGGRGLECRWQPATAEEQPAEGRGRSAYVAGPALVPAIGQTADQLAS